MPADLFDLTPFVRAELLARYRQIIDQRVEILAAFVAQHNCLPDEAAQVVIKIDRNTEVFYVTKRSEDPTRNAVKSARE